MIGLVHAGTQVHAADDMRAAAWMQRSRRNEDELLVGQVGVGITLAKDAGGNLRVAGLLDGAPAQRSGRVSVEDVLVYVDGVDVRGNSAQEAAARILGRSNSAVVLGLQRGSSANTANLLSWEDIVTKSSPDPEVRAARQPPARAAQHACALALQKLQQGLAGEGNTCKACFASDSINHESSKRCVQKRLVIKRCHAYCTHGHECRRRRGRVF